MRPTEPSFACGSRVRWSLTLVPNRFCVNFCAPVLEIFCAIFENGVSRQRPPPLPPSPLGPPPLPPKISCRMACHAWQPSALLVLPRAPCGSRRALGAATLRGKPAFEKCPRRKRVAAVVLWQPVTLRRDGAPDRDGLTHRVPQRQPVPDVAGGVGSPAAVIQSGWQPPFPCGRRARGNPLWRFGRVAPSRRSVAAVARKRGGAPDRHGLTHRVPQRQPAPDVEGGAGSPAAVIQAGGSRRSPVAGVRGGTRCGDSGGSRQAVALWQPLRKNGMGLRIARGCHMEKRTV
jgi:hypothetical protein